MSPLELVEQKIFDIFDSRGFWQNGGNFDKKFKNCLWYVST